MILQFCNFRKPKKTKEILKSKCKETGKTFKQILDKGENEMFSVGDALVSNKKEKIHPPELYLLACFTKTTTNKQFYMEIVHDDNEIDAKKAEKITKKKKREYFVI